MKVRLANLIIRVHKVEGRTDSGELLLNAIHAPWYTLPHIHAPYPTYTHKLISQPINQ